MVPAECQRSWPMMMATGYLGVGAERSLLRVVGERDAGGVQVAISYAVCAEVMTSPIPRVLLPRPAQAGTWGPSPASCSKMPLTSVAAH